MLVTILEFAVERFVASDEALAILARHAEYYLALADSGNIHVEAQGGENYEIILPDLANFRAVLERALADGDTELGLSMAVALEQFWVSNNPAEGERWFAAFFAGRRRAAGIARHGRCALVAARSSSREGSRKGLPITGSRSRCTASWAMTSGPATSCFASLSRRTGPAIQALARTLAEESRALHRGQSPWAESQVLSVLGNIAIQDGRQEEALDLLTQSAELADQVGSGWLPDRFAPVGR